eukprot:gene12589-10802_t
MAARVLVGLTGTAGTGPRAMPRLRCPGPGVKLPSMIRTLLTAALSGVGAAAGWKPTQCGSPEGTANIIT